MGKLPYTPRSRVRSALRKLWMTSRERSSALKRDGYCCRDCGAKQSTAKGHEVKVECHHLHPGSETIQMEQAIDYIYRRILCPPEDLVTLCQECHRATHKEEKC